MILSFWTDMPGQTVQTQIRLEEQSDQGLNSGQLIFKYVFSELFQSKRLLKYDTYVES